MNVVIQIKDREAIPVRAIPFLTCWQTMTPDALGLALAGDEHFHCFESVQAHRTTDGEALQQRWWHSNVVRPCQALSDKLKATETTHETGLQDFHAESLKMLPAGVYVWRDEFEQAHQRHYSGTTLPVDCDGNVMTRTDSEVAKLTAAHQERIALDFSPLITTELYALVMDGFPSGAEQVGPVSSKSEKLRLLWRAVSFDENRVKAAMNELEKFPPKGISDIAIRDEKRAALRAELTQIVGRKDWLALQMSIDMLHAAERRFTVEEMTESRQPLSVEEALFRTCEIEIANKGIDALIAEPKAHAPALSNATPAPSPAPMVDDGGAPASLPAVANWKMLVQAEATELFLRLLASGANPTPHSILDSMATWCRANNIKTGGKNGGINPSANYLRTHVLAGKHWKPPTMSREQAKKHVAQVAHAFSAQIAHRQPK